MPETENERLGRLVTWWCYRCDYDFDDYDDVEPICTRCEQSDMVELLDGGMMNTYHCYTPGPCPRFRASEKPACEHPSNMWRLNVPNPHCAACGEEFQRVPSKIKLLPPSGEDPS